MIRLSRSYWIPTNRAGKGSTGLYALLHLASKLKISLHVSILCLYKYQRTLIAGNDILEIPLLWILEAKSKVAIVLGKSVEGACRSRYIVKISCSVSFISYKLYALMDVMSVKVKSMRLGCWTQVGSSCRIYVSSDTFGVQIRSKDL